MTAPIADTVADLKRRVEETHKAYLLAVRALNRHLDAELIALIAARNDGEASG